MNGLLRAARAHGTPLDAEFQLVSDALERVPASAARFDRAAWQPATLRQLAQEWRGRMALEHRSSMVFTQLAAQLYEANAALDEKTVMLRMAQDEFRHTETCAKVIEALGEAAEVEVDLTVPPLARHPNASPEQRALRNVLYTTCCSELVACGNFVATMDRMSDAFMKDVTRRILADEVLHGQFGFHYARRRSEWLKQNPAERESLERYLRHAFKTLEHELAAPAPVVRMSDELRALGGVDLSLARDVFYETLEHAVVPGLEACGIDASTAWSTRAFLG